MEPILRVQNLTKTFTRSGQSNLTAVNGISFDLLPGECLGIIGESGSGGHYAENGKITPHDLSENADGFSDTDRFL